MRWITEQSLIRCGHNGRIGNKPSQRWVTIAGVPVLVHNDPEGRTIAACPNSGPTMKACMKTLRVHKGYSEWLRIGGQQVVLAHLDGLTDGTVPGTVHYSVVEPRQVFVDGDR